MTASPGVRSSFASLTAATPSTPLARPGSAARSLHSRLLPPRPRRDQVYDREDDDPDDDDVRAVESREREERRSEQVPLKREPVVVEARELVDLTTHERHPQHRRGEQPDPHATEVAP